MKQIRRVAAALLAAGSLYSGMVAADSDASSMAGSVDRKLFGGDFSFNGLLRLEVAYSTNGKISAANQEGLGSNGVPIQRVAGIPGPGGFLLPLTGTTQVASLLSNLGVNVPVVTGGPPPRGVSNSTGVSDVMTRYIPAGTAKVNYHVLRFEASPNINWSGGWSLQTRIRAIYEPDGLGYNEFNYDDYSDINHGFQTGINGTRQYSGKPDQLGYSVDGRKNPLWFERSGRNYQVDLPAFFVQWTNGNETIRIGNQSVAWGQLLFFRIMDVANGLDLRRHLFIDRAIEEYADERESAPGIRFTWQATDQIVVDTFAQQFVPSIVPNANTTYNIVDSRFILHDNYHKNGADKQFNYGIRVKGEYGNYNLQAMATSRLNQLGAIRWAKSNIVKPLPNSNYLGAAFNIYCESPAYAANAALHGLTGSIAQASAPGQGCGPQFSQTAFEVAPGGLNSAEEWFDRASYTKLSGTEGLNRALRDFPVTSALLTSEVGNNVAAAANELDAFFMASEGLHGHVQRDYYRETVLGLGGGYVVDAEPGSLLDQLIMNVEATYTPHRIFTATSLGDNYDKREEYQVGFVAEKYQRFFESVPATYMVFQYLWQKNSSLEGLLLDGYGSENYSATGVKLTGDVPTNLHPKITPGIHGGANYVVLAALQPTNAYIFEYSVAALVDVQGGVLVQPAVQWKPRGNMTVNLFYNYINASAWGGNANKSFLSFIDFANEVTVRLGYQF